jgi:hypothetical protein
LAVYDIIDNTILNNTVNGKPLVYLEGAENIIIDYPVGQVIAVGSINITIKGVVIENTTIGVEFINTQLQNRELYN